MPERDDELLNRLIREQRQDGRWYQDAERFGGDRALSLEPFGESLSEENESFRDPETAVWRANRLSQLPPRRARTQQDRDLLFRVCEDLLTNLPTDKERAVRLVVYVQATLREAAQALGVVEGTIRQRLRYAYDLMRPVLRARAGSELIQWPHRDTDVASVCAAPGCISGLSRMNPHTLCRVHAGAAVTEGEFVLANILGAGTRGGPDARSVAVPAAAPAPVIRDVWAGTWSVNAPRITEPAYLDEPYVPVPRRPIEHLTFREVAA